MSSRIVVIVVLIIGVGIGSIVPAATSCWYDNQRAGLAFNSNVSETVSTQDDSAKVTYHFGFEQGVLSLIEETPGEGDKVIVTGLDVQAWSREMLDMALQVEFYSLDEVQSFIDTVNEPLWQE